MKKLFVMLMSAALVLSFASCAKEDSGNTDTSSAVVSETEAETAPETEADTEEEPVTEAEEENEPSEDANDDSSEADGDASSGDNTASDSAALAILDAVWSSYGDDEKFPVFGGDLSEDSLNMEGPGIYRLGEPDVMDGALGFPAASADKIDDAASLTNMLNANTFTCGVYHVIDPADTEELTAAIKDNILARQWMCGFPEKVVVLTVDDCIVAAFGHDEPIDTFVEKLNAAYPSTQLVSDDPIM